MELNEVLNFNSNLSQIKILQNCFNKNLEGILLENKMNFFIETNNNASSNNLKGYFVISMNFKIQILLIPILAIKNLLHFNLNLITCIQK